MTALSSRSSLAACFLIGSIVAAGGQAPAPAEGVWRTMRKPEGEILTFGPSRAGDASWIFAACRSRAVDLVARVPPGPRPADVRRLVGQRVELAFQFGTVRYVYAGRASDNQVSGAVEASLRAKSDDPLFRAMRGPGTTMRIDGPLGGVDIPLRGAGTAVDAWINGCER